jgi:hypothetical protein
MAKANGSNAAPERIHIEHHTLQPVFLYTKGVVVEVSPDPLEGVANLFPLSVEAFLHGFIWAQNLECNNTVFFVDAE